MPPQPYNILLACSLPVVAQTYYSESVVHDFISSLILLFERPVRIGDWIEVDGQEGIVKRVGARASLMMSSEVERSMWLPNSRLTSNRVTNWTLRGDSGYVRVVSPLRTDTDEKEASELILEVAAGHQVRQAG